MRHHKHRMPRRAILTLMLAAASAPCFSGEFHWSLSHFALGKRALVLSSQPQSVTLRSGWVCVVAAPTGGELYQARTTTCVRNGEQFHFAVQCDSNRPSDHTQVGLWSKEQPDYIEVSCASQ
jgi:hypothetical protein